MEFKELEGELWKVKCFASEQQLAVRILQYHFIGKSGKSH